MRLSKRKTRVFGGNRDGSIGPEPCWPGGLGPMATFFPRPKRSCQARLGLPGSSGAYRQGLGLTFPWPGRSLKNLWGLLLGGEARGKGPTRNRSRGSKNYVGGHTIFLEGNIKPTGHFSHLRSRENYVAHFFQLGHNNIAFVALPARRETHSGLFLREKRAALCAGVTHFSPLEANGVPNNIAGQ